MISSSKRCVVCYSPETRCANFADFRIIPPRTYFTTVALTSSPQEPVSPRVETQRAW